MSKSRLEAFSDGVLAIIITIMVLEFKVPHDGSWESFQPIIPVALTYALSFVYCGIYWSNHHHLFQAVHHVNGRVLWANLHLLFWLSLTPFVTAWMGHSFTAIPVACYAVLQFLAGFAFFILTRVLISTHGKDSALARALGTDVKGLSSVIGYSIAIPLAFYSPTASCLIFVFFAGVWVMPDKRFERVISEAHEKSVVPIHAET